LARWLPAGIPADPFAAADPIRFREEGGDLLVWSVGPDKKDDRGAVTYDPTNGSTSAGDVLLRIPAQRRYPFPEGGVKAANAAELLRQFPNGMPQDLFSVDRNRPLSILDATTTQPLTIFSWGPDYDQNTARLPAQDKGRSRGRPAAERQLIFQRPASGTGAPPEASGFDPDLTDTRYAGKPFRWDLEPRYDPTNGTASAGDLFVEISGH
jgi:hypothetical protein